MRPVMLLTNAPRPVVDVAALMQRIGVPLDCYDAIVSSGAAAREDVARRIAAGGPHFAASIIWGPSVTAACWAGWISRASTIAEAEIVLCTGLLDDETETADDYADPARR